MSRPIPSPSETGLPMNYCSPEGRAHLDAVHSGPVLSWDSPELARITRLRLVSDPGFPMWDVSYCHGETVDGRKCRVTLPFIQLPKGGINATIIREARRDGVYAKGLGVFDAISTLC